jgi:RNA polymerase sigma factor (sigma-70 family)
MGKKFFRGRAQSLHDSSQSEGEGFRAAKAAKLKRIHALFLRSRDGNAEARNDLHRDLREYFEPKARKKLSRDPRVALRERTDDVVHNLSLRAIRWLDSPSTSLPADTDELESRLDSWMNVNLNYVFLDMHRTHYGRKGRAQPDGSTGRLRPRVWYGLPDDNRLPAQSSGSEKRVNQATLRELIAKLSPEDQELIKLHLSGHNYSEIAEELNMDDKTVKRWLDRIREHLGRHRRSSE